MKTITFLVLPASTTAAPTNQTTSSSIKKSKPYYVVVIAIVLGAIILGACCIVCIACSWKRKRSARRKDQECMSPKNYNGKVSKIENNVNGSQKVKILVESTNDQESGDDGSSKGESSDYTDNKDEPDMIDSDVQFSCDENATSKDEEQHNQVYNNSKHFNGTPKHQHGIETFPNGYVNGLNIKDIGVDIIKSDVVAPTKEAQYASIVAVPTNPKYSGKVCNQTVLTTFAPVYEENVTNFAHKEYPVYATIDSFKSAAHIPLVKTTTRPHDLNYAELAAFDCNAWHHTKRPPPYEETKYAAVKVSPEYH